MEKIVNRSLTYFAKPEEVASCVREAIDRGIVTGLFYGGETQDSCGPSAIEKLGVQASGAYFFHLFSDLRPGFDVDKDKALSEGCYIRLAPPRLLERTMRKSGLDTKGPPERARFFARIARIFRKNLSHPTFGFTPEMDHSVTYNDVWHSAGARRFLLDQGWWKHFSDGSVYFDFREPEGKPARS